MDVNQPVRTNYGNILILLACLIPMISWSFSYDFSGLAAWETVAIILAKGAAFGGMAMFAISLILSGRYAVFDKLFGGLDKMYTTHRFLGTFSLVLLFIHPIALSIFKLPGGVAGSLKMWVEVSNVSVWLGALALYLLIGFVIWSIFAKVAYEKFQKIHKLLGYVFLIGASHAFLAGSILAKQDFTFWYMLTLTLAAAFTYLNFSLLRDVTKQPLSYKVAGVNSTDDNIVEIHLHPNTSHLVFTPGQFVYIAFEDIDKHDYHPFSIASGRQSSHLKLAIRKVGDFTHKLSHLQSGAKARIKGPYGGFRLQPNNRRKQLWIAGGIGVTPFLSGARSLNKKSKIKKVAMYYASDDKHPHGLSELKDIAANLRQFTCKLHRDDKMGYLTLQQIADDLKDNLSDYDIFICGPPPMLRSLVAQAEELGIAENLHYEEFSY